MKQILLVLIAAATLSGCAQKTDEVQTKRIAAYCKVWGFLKYYHPAVADHDLDWDSTFIQIYRQVKSAASAAEYDKALISLFDKAQDAGKRENHISDKPDSNYEKSYPNVDFSWIDDRSVISTDLSSALHKVRDEFRPHFNHYIARSEAGNPDVGNDNEFSESQYPIEPIRVLALARYWNIINYFYPYKDVIGSPWDSMLLPYVPRMIEAKDTMEYQLGVLEFAHKINDGHSFAHSEFIREYFGRGMLPFDVAYIDGKTVVVGNNPYAASNSDSLFHAMGIRKGDILEKIDGKDVDKIRADLLKYVSGSNDGFHQVQIDFMLLMGKPAKTIPVTFNRGSSPFTAELKYESYEGLNYHALTDTGSPWRILKNNIGYVNLDHLTVGNADSAMTQLLDTKYIIFDLRNYPKQTLWKLLSYLTPSHTFFLASFPNLQRPGYLHKDSDSADMAGKETTYKGKIIILVNEMTMSHAEFTAMALQSVPGAKTFGSQTAGADGNVSHISLPGQIDAYFSGIGIFYPDGSPTQRVGVKIDYVVRPTIKGIREGKDEVLERAVKYVETGS
ncbi:MAG: S41 family peptidase [Bacteroidota bacterium]|nr:S41 family peptidase [Bacteroidota bacterium]